MKKYWIVGIDEVGRGPLAGPVTVCALALRSGMKFINLRDSKKLSPQKREEWFAFIRKKKIPYALASVSPKIVDKINIREATNLAATRAFRKLITNYQLPIARTKVFLDGGLYLNAQLTAKYKPKTIIKGDEKIQAISLASITAKVMRDRMMVRLHKKYQKYKFHIHKGYGTRAHIAAIAKYGPSDIHRLTFIRKFVNM